MKAAWVVVLFLATGISTGSTAQGGASPAQSVASIARRVRWEGLAIIVDRNNPTSNVTLRQLREILFADRQWWSCNRRITLATMPRGSVERQTISRTIYKMDDVSLDRYFFFEVYRGLLPTSPTILDTPADVKRFVSGTPGAVGYMRASDVDDSVKVLRIDGLLPGDDGYPLRLRTRVPK